MSSMQKSNLAIELRFNWVGKLRIESWRVNRKIDEDVLNKIRRFSRQISNGKEIIVQD